MEGLNKYLGTHCLISGETQKDISGQLVTRFLGRFQLKGFEKAVEVYELVGWPQDEPSSRAWRESFALGLKHYQQGRFADASKEFDRTLQFRPGDGPAKFYLKRFNELGTLERPVNWTGDIELKEK
jgi:adenylate cyclase